MKQTHLLELPNALKVRFIMVDHGADIVWSRRLRKRDIPNLVKYYVPWRDDLLRAWANQRKKPLDFIDLPIAELVFRYPK